MPGHDSSVPGRLAKKLIVPEADRAVQELAGRHGKGRIPEHVVHGRRDPPSAQGVKEHRRLVRRLVAVVLIKEPVARIRRIGERRQLLAQRLDLRIAQQSHAGQIAVLPIKIDLVLRQAVFLPVGRRVRQCEQVAHELVA